MDISTSLRMKTAPPKTRLIAGGSSIGLLVIGLNSLIWAFNLTPTLLYSSLVTVLGFIIFGYLALTLIKPEQPNQRPVEEELQRVNRALKVLGQGNQIIIRAADEATLLPEICQSIVEAGSYRLAWVGMVEHDKGRRIQPVAQWGYEAGYLEEIAITWARDDVQGQGPAGQAVRNGQPCVVHHILEDSSFEPWRSEAIKRGYNSVLALPLAQAGAVFGVLLIYAPDPDAFDKDEVDLLNDLAKDLAYGIRVLRARTEYIETEKALYHFETKTRALINALPDTMIRLDQNGVCLDIKVAKDGEPWHPPEAMIGQPIANYLPAALAKKFTQATRKALKTKHRQVFEYQWANNGNRRDYEARIVLMQADRVVAIIRDITDRKTREAIIEEERARIARDLHDGLAQNLYFLGLKLDYLTKQVERGQADSLADELGALKKMVQANIREIRRTIFSLRPINLEELGFAQAVEKYSHDFGEQANLRIHLNLEGDPEPLPRALEPVLFRLVQEGLNNIAKHAEADQAWITVSIEPEHQVQLLIRDNGLGFNPRSIPAMDNTKLGLSQMQQRVTTLGGVFNITSQPNQGTTLEAIIPLNGTNRANGMPEMPEIPERYGETV